MKKKLIMGGCLLIVLVVSCWLVNYYHYSPPTMKGETMISLAEKQLMSEAPDLLKKNVPPQIKKKLSSVKVLGSQEIDKKTYLVFKMDYTFEGPVQEMGMVTSGYMLVLRQAEKSWGGLTLKKGMEFESSYGGVSPADCGYHPDGIFYGFCKDSRVSKALVETDDKQIFSSPIENRLILMGVAPRSREINPGFYDQEGNKIEPSYGMKFAFISEQEDNYKKYNNFPFEWYLLSKSGIEFLAPESVDAIWVFADQYQEVLQESNVLKLSELVQEGIPVLFVDMKDTQAVAQAFNLKAVDEGIKAKDILAVYIRKTPAGANELGVIGLDDGLTSPLLEKSMAFRWQMDDISADQKSPPREDIKSNLPESKAKLPDQPVSAQKEVAN